MWHQLSLRLLQLLADNKIKLREEDTTFLQAFVWHECNNNEPLSAHTILDSQLVRAVALLLKRLLEQHRLRSVGWQRAAYCRMVRTAASSMRVICRRITACGQPAATARISMSRHLVVSGVLQLLPAALTELASVMQSTTTTDPLAEAAHAVLTASIGIISAWPGAAGIISSKDAGPLALPAVQLASVLEQHMTTRPPTYVLPLTVLVRQLVMALAEQLAHQQQQHCPDLMSKHPLVKSPDFLRLLLTFIAVELRPSPRSAVLESAGADAAAGSLVVSGPTLIAATDANTSCPAEEDRKISSSDSCPTTAGCEGAAEPAAASESIGNPVARTVAAADAEAASPAQQHTAHIRQQQLQMLQHLHPAMQHDSDRETLVLEGLLNSREGEPSSVPQPTALVYVAAQCVWSVGRALGDFASGSSDSDSDNNNSSSSSSSSSSDSDNSSEADRQYMCLPDASTATALCDLPLMLLHVWNSRTETETETETETAPSPAVAAPEFYKAVGMLISKTILCWEAQLWLQAAGLPHGISEDQLPIAELQVLLLQHLELQVQQYRSNQAAVTGPTGGDTASSGSNITPTPAAAAAPSEAPAGRAWAGGASTHSFIELLSILADLQTVTGNADWRPTAALTGMLEHCFRMSSSSREGDINIVASSQSSSSSSPSVSTSCCDLIDDRRLPSVCSGLIGVGKRHRPQPGSSPDYYMSFNTTYWEPGPVLLAATAAAPGSREQQQLFTMLISISKKPRLLSKQVQASSGDPERLTPLHACSLYDVVRTAANNMLPYNINSSEEVLPSSSAVYLAARRPWLVVLGRNLIDLAGELDDVLGDIPACDSRDRYVHYQRRPHDHRSGLHLFQCSKHLLELAGCISLTVYGLLKVCFRCADGDASHSTSSSSTAPAAQCSETATAAAAADLTPRVAAAGDSSSADAVTQQQLSQLLQVQQQLRSDDLDLRFAELQDLCLILCGIYVRYPRKIEKVYSA